jgi:hypothetical protein
MSAVSEAMPCKVGGFYDICLNISLLMDKKTPFN